MMSDVRVFADLPALSAAAAEATADTIGRAARAEGRCALVLSGGHTPRMLYQLLATTYRDRIPWPAVHLFWGDERYVPPTDARSNYGMVKDALLDHVPCPAANIHPMPTNAADPDSAARAYEATLRDYFAGSPPRFDLVLLGLGEEGHTASLFPRSPALAERTRWVVAVTAPADPPVRLTLTLSGLADAAATYFLVAGSNKAHAFSHVMSASADPNEYPAAGVRQGMGTVTWWIDRQAAREYAAAEPARTVTKSR
jgi:6-phosphogluconolactonase